MKRRDELPTEVAQSAMSSSMWVGCHAVTGPTHRGDEPQDKQRGAKYCAADRVRPLRYEAPRAGLVHGVRHRAHNDARMVPQVGAARGRAGLGGMVEDVAQLVAFVAALRQEACEVRCRKVAMAKELQHFPHLQVQNIKKSPTTHTCFSGYIFSSTGIIISAGLAEPAEKLRNTYIHGRCIVVIDCGENCRILCTCTI